MDNEQRDNIDGPGGTYLLILTLFMYLVYIVLTYILKRNSQKKHDADSVFATYHILLSPILLKSNYYLCKCP